MPTTTTYPDGTQTAVRQTPRGCDHPGCAGEGKYRAPRARDALTSYFWFCLEHVRAYNACWNYYEGMSADQIEAHARRDAVWQRPSWRFGSRVAGRIEAAFDDPLGVLGVQRQAPADPSARQWPPNSPEARALRVLEIDGPVTLAAVKRRYKELAKRHHPDANGGCREAEERLKSINVAYMTLRKTLSAAIR